MSAVLADDELLIDRILDAPVSLVFALWSDPEHLKRWMGPQTFDCPFAEVDFRVGGAYRMMIRSSDGGENWFGGVYREIEPNRRLVFTYVWEGGPSAGVETVVTLLFEDLGGRTRQVFHQRGFARADRRDAHVGGWTSAFVKQAAYAEAVVREMRR